MASRFAVLACVLMLGVGCGSDLYVAEPEDDADVGPSLVERVEALQPWTPAVRFVGTPEQLADVRLFEVSNYRFYDRDDFGLRGVLEERLDGFNVFAGDVVRESIHPPLQITVYGQQSNYPRLITGGLVPAPGDTLVLDFAAGDVFVDLDVDVPAAWGQTRLQTLFEYRVGVADWFVGDRVYCCDRIDIDGVENGSVPIVLPATVHRVVEWRLNWIGGDGPAPDFAIPSDIRAVWNQSPQNPNQNEVENPRLELQARPVVLDVRLAGERVDVVPLRVVLETANGGDGPDNWFTRYTDPTNADGFVPVHTLSSRTTVRIEPITKAIGVLIERRSFPAAAGDTLVVELGENRVEVRATDEDGEPMVGVELRAVRRAGASSNDLYTDANGVAVFHLPDGFYEFDMYRPSLVGQRSQSYRVRGDQVLVIEWER